MKNHMSIIYISTKAGVRYVKCLTACRAGGSCSTGKAAIQGCLPIGIWIAYKLLVVFGVVVFDVFPALVVDQVFLE